MNGYLHLVGHSLGGGLATTGALTNGLKATVFNPAVVHAETLARHDTDFRLAKQNITVYRLQNEFLTTAQESKSKLGIIMPDTVGTVHTIKDPNGWRMHIPGYNVYHWGINRRMVRVLSALNG